MFQMGGYGSVRRTIGPRCARRRHFVRAEFARNSLPDFGIGADALDIERVDGQAGGLPFFVVTGDAVFRKDGRRRPGGGLAGLKGSTTASLARITAGLKAGTTYLRQRIRRADL
jgi:hypothetical protein